MIPNRPTVAPGQNIAGETETVYWANGWPATAMADPHNLRTLQDSPLKGAMFRNKFNFLFENLDLVNDFDANDVLIKIMTETDTEFPPWVAGYVTELSWGAYIGMILRTLISAEIYNPIPGIVAPYGIRWNLEHYQGLEPDLGGSIYGWNHELQPTPDPTPITYGLSTSEGTFCPIYISWETHDQWRIYYLSHLGEIGGEYEFEGDSIRTFWGQDIFSDKYELVQTGSIINGRLIGCPEYISDAPFPVRTEFTNTGTINLAGGWVLMTGNSEHWYRWEEREGWNPGEALWDGESQEILYKCNP